MLSRIVDSFSGMPKDLLTIGNEGKGIEEIKDTKTES